ncbi:MAG: SGNH/GDSL hydrolase family protein [Flammeovirgaceae bacterium]|nr:SGNH/GDSL hydrolase family protein [Flammeovirgaceae bacterium]
MENEKSYLALGDSYTVGESVDAEKTWPVQLVNFLKKNKVEVGTPKIIATTGWTTNELISAIKEENINKEFDLVSLLIGVNNQYRGYPIDQYKKEFEELLQISIIYANDDPSKVFVLSIPDYGVTPFASERNPEKIGKELDEYNAIAEAICKQYKVCFFDITPISKNAKNDPELVADDGLHPSGKMYMEWVDLIWKDVFKMI